MTLHDDTSSGVDATLTGSRASVEDVVSGACLDDDASAAAGYDSTAETEMKWVFDAHNGHQSHMLRETSSAGWKRV